LHALNVELDVVNIDIDPKAESFQHISLINLGVRVHDPPAADTEAIARIIFAMLPNVRFANTWSGISMHLESLKASSNLDYPCLSS
jgi:hypothetical protein